MKRILIWGFTVFVVSCNNKKQNDIPGSTVTTQEEKLKAEIIKYPDSLILMENLVQYYREGGNYDEAVKTINQALQKDSSIARLWDIKGTLHLEDDDTLNAIKAFEKAISIFPEPVYVISLGTLYAQTKNENALTMADALLIGNKANANREAFFIKGLYFSATHQKEKAIGFFDKALATDYGFMEAYREKAIALYDLQKYTDALQVLQKAVKLNNRYEEGYYYMGLNFEKLGKKEEAIESYETALIYAPDYIEAKDALAKLGIKH